VCKGSVQNFFAKLILKQNIPMSEKIKVFKMEVQNSEGIGELLVESKDDIVEAVQELIDEFDYDDGFEMKISSTYLTREEIEQSQAVKP
jgi:hypothetical protein